MIIFSNIFFDHLFLFSLHELGSLLGFWLFSRVFIFLCHVPVDYLACSLLDLFLCLLLGFHNFLFLFKDGLRNRLLNFRSFNFFVDFFSDSLGH